MNKTDFIKIYDVIKGMKCDIFHIYKDMIIGTDKEYTTLTEVILDTKTTKPYEIDKDSINNIVDSLKLLVDEEINIEIYFNEFSTKSYSITNLESIYLGIALLRIPSMYIEDLRSNNDFIDIIEKKSVEGASMLKLNKKFIITIFKGLLPINKKDKVSLEIYEIDNYKFLAKYIINKGKFIVYKYISYTYI